MERHEAPRSNYPTKLPADVVDLDRVLRNVLNSYSSSVSGFTPLARDWIAAQSNLSTYQLSSFLGQLDRPSVPGLVQLIAKDLKQNNDVVSCCSLFSRSMLVRARDIVSHPCFV